MLAEVPRTLPRMPGRPIRYLAAADVTAAMPPLAERLELAERTLTALVNANPDDWRFPTPNSGSSANWKLANRKT